MKIAVVGPSPIPYTRGGIENFLSGLHRAINEATEHSAELIKVPVREDTVLSLLKAYRIFYRLNLNHFDLVITTKYPAWMIRHRNHILYLGHRLRGLYDTYPGQPDTERFLEFSPFAFPGPWIRKIIHFLDDFAFHPRRISYVYCTSGTIAGRSDYFHPDMPPEVVYHSTAREDFYRRPGRYLFTVNRLDAPKRIDMIVRAYRHVSGETPLLIAGTGPQMAQLLELAGDDRRIRFLGSVSEEKLLELYASAIGVLYTPEREDYGLITIEAMKSGKPVITLADSGGPLEFVEDGVTGYIAEPNPESLAKAIERLLSDPEHAEVMGTNAQKRVAHISWKNTVNRILAPYRYWPDIREKYPGEKRRVLVLVPYRVFPPSSGGQRRVASIYTALSEYFDIRLLTLSRHGESPFSIEINSHLHEISIPISIEHARRQWTYEKALNTAVSDVVLPGLLKHSFNYLRALSHMVKWAEVIVSSHPYLHPFIPGNCGKTIVHESHNFEWALKKTFLPRTREGRRCLRWVRKAERDAVRKADLLLAVSREEGMRLSRTYGRIPESFIVVPNGVDTREVTPSNSRERLRARESLHINPTAVAALFTGAWHKPNLDAFCTILKDLAPACPNIDFIIMGSVKNQYEARIGSVPELPNIRVMGEVDEQTRLAVLKAVDIGLNPMRLGSGTNLKIIEYFAAGLAVVTTPTGMRGLEIIPGNEALVCSITSFPHRLHLLALSETLRHRLGQAARRFAERFYDWRHIAHRAASAIEKIVPPPTPPPSSMEDSRYFTMGWHPLELWEVPGNDPIAVRWTKALAQIHIPDMRKNMTLQLRVSGPARGVPVSIFVDGTLHFQGTIQNEWTQVEVPVIQKPGHDWHTITIRSKSWSPSDDGSPDTRKLGIAASGIKLLDAKRLS